MVNAYPSTIVRNQSVNLGCMATGEIETFGGRLQWAIDEAGISPAELARALGLTSTAISKLRHGTSKSMSPHNLFRAAWVLGVDPYWLATGRGSPGRNGVKERHGEYDLASEEHFAYIPRISVDLSAGHGNDVENEQVEEYLAFRRDWLRHEGFDPSSLRITSANGDSMAPRIQDGDVLLVDTNRKDIKDGCVYAIRYDHLIRVKRLFWGWDGALVISSDSPDPAYREERVPKKDLENITIVGRVVWVAGRI